LQCPHCCAENPDGSAFCSLCLSRFSTAPTTAQAAPPPLDSSYAAGAPINPPQQQYVSPGDYRSLARDMYSNPAMASPGPHCAYYQAANAPRIGQKMSAGHIVILVLGRSFLTYLLLFAVNLLIALFLLGAAFGGSEAGLSLGIGMIYAATALVLVLSGYWISSIARDPGKGWTYGLACVAAVVFFWQPAIAMLLALFMTGRVFVPIFNIAGVMIATFLYLPLGALGGWIAEKRYYG
jgi:hypothetical protein